MSQQYSLRWNNHQPNFISMFETLLTTKTLVDVTLAAEGQHLVAHKVVLSACSTYFHSLFVDNPSHHPIVILKDVTFADLRTMVDFMYYGQVNVTEEQLPQVLETAKVLKIKGLTEMPDSTSLTRSSDYNSADNSLETQRQSASPCSPTRRKRRRKSSSGSVNCIGENIRNDEIDQNINMTRELPTVTLSSLPHKRRDDKIEETAQQTGEPSNLNIDLNMEANIIPQDPLSMVFLRQRRSKIFKRQCRVSPEEQEMKKQASEPAPAPSSAVPILQKHDSYPQYKPPKVQTSDSRRLKAEQSVGSLLIRAFAVVDTSGQSRAQTSTATPSVSSAEDAPQTQRASHTPAVRSGPPLSCNFCWNTVDECGRILRRKTQYHCPECRTNLCIVPCFHEYHDGPDAEASASAR